MEEGYIELLISEFSKNKIPEIASGQKGYMKDKFDFYGLKSPIRKELQKPFLLKSQLPPKENMWLQRSALLFQLKYKDEVDTALLSYGINSLLGSKDFFINKAIGWSLRQYSKFNSSWVINFVDKTKLENLSKREALRLIK